MLKSFFSLLRGILGSFKVRSTEYLEFELRELENIFAILLMGSFVGIPSPPTPIALRVMPYMAREMAVMSKRAETADDMLCEIGGLLDIG
jgi:hypothetical protein